MYWCHNISRISSYKALNLGFENSHDMHKPIILKITLTSAKRFYEVKTREHDRMPFNSISYACNLRYYTSA